jgi:aminoglycoside phosphotransferase (APT) family kinase protein
MNDDLLNIEKLSAFLARQPGWETALPVRNVARVGLGQSNLTFRVELSDRTVILRRPPPGPLPPKAHDVLREYRVLQALHPSAVPVPQPLLASEDNDILGAPFYIMEALPGDAIRYELPPDILARPDFLQSIGYQLVETLASLHMTPPASVGLEDLGNAQGYITRQLATFSKQLKLNHTRSVENLEKTTVWLYANLPPEPARPTIVHGDYKLDNVLFSLQPEPRLLGVVDWELATLGDPFADLGWVLAFWCEDGSPPPALSVVSRLTEQPGFPRRADLAVHYSNVTRQELPDLTFYNIFAHWKLAIVLEGHWARYVRGTAGDFDFGYLETAGPLYHEFIHNLTVDLR